jgi:hypothetical protein
MIQALQTLTSRARSRITSLRHRQQEPPKYRNSLATEAFFAESNGGFTRSENKIHPQRQSWASQTAAGRTPKAVKGRPQFSTKDECGGFAMSML